MSFRPLLAPVDSPLTNPDFFKKLRFPLLGSAKIDGIRAVNPNDGMYSRKGILLPSYQVQAEFQNAQYLDGELTAGRPNLPGIYNITQSYVMSYDKIADILYFNVFDWIAPDCLRLPYYIRLEKLKTNVALHTNPGIRMVEHVNIENLSELEAFEEAMLAQGYEGIMLRDPVAPYKNGRGTFNQGIIYKLKRFEDTEAVITGFVEQMTNLNELVKDDLGYAKRSKAKDGLAPAGTLGKFIVDWQGVELEIPPGMFSHAERQHIWDNQDKYLNAILKFRYFGHGVKDKPRMPRAIGFRSKIDL